MNWLNIHTHMSMSKIKVSRSDTNCFLSLLFMSLFPEGDGGGRVNLTNVTNFTVYFLRHPRLKSKKI